MQKWRLLTLLLDDPYRNMAVDESMLIACEKGFSPPTLRFYSWRPSAVTTGCSHKNVEDVIDTAGLRSFNIPLVRRPTGGGILFHYNDLSYSIISDKTHRGLSRPIDSYRAIHNSFLNSFKAIGLKGQFRFCEKSSARNNLCFLNHTRFEVVVGDKKVLGSAQRWLRNSFLQHGSIFLEPPPSEILRFFKGLDEEEVSRNIFWLKDYVDSICINDLVDSFLDYFSCTSGIKFTPAGLTPFEEMYADKLLKEKYGRDSWNIRGEQRDCRLSIDEPFFNHKPSIINHKS